MTTWMSSGAGHALIAAAIVVVTTLSMEVVATVLHRLWMHGPGWGWHRSHHEPASGRRWERNDAFGLLFAAVAIGFAAVGNGPWWPVYWVAIGMTIYGVLYAILHDGLVHRRWPLRWAPRHPYLLRLMRAHRLHHAVTERRGAVSFGFLYAAPVADIAAAVRARRRRGDAVSQRRRRIGQGAIGAGLASALVAAWVAAVGYGLFMHAWTLEGALLAPLLVVAICWLDVGLFIVAHDAMHGSLVPASRRLNDAIGSLCLMLYGGFTLHRFGPRHFEHHRRPGTADDPDFDSGTQRFWPWYLGFMRRYFGWPEALGLVTTFGVLTIVLRAPLASVLVFWALPSMLSSLQLFAFGTWLPHRRAGGAFADEHRARSNAFGWTGSLLTCFHFGYHHEHHLRPDTPWWRLPGLRRTLRTGSPGSDSAAATGSPAVP